jgi:sulfur-oxidizing protein SoxY
MDSQLTQQKVTRRNFLQGLGALGITGIVALSGAGSLVQVAAESVPPGAPLPDEKVEDTMKRLFGGRPISAGESKVKLQAPLIAENGSVVPVTVDADLPMTADKYVKNIYIIADKNRRPLNAKFSLTPDAGKAFVSSNIRLADTTDLRAIVEMNDGSLYMVKQQVRVTVGGCGG